VFVSRLRADKVDPGAIRLALFAGHYREDRPWTAQLLADAEARLARWREAVSLETGPSAEDTVTRLRDHLSDDLDTPKALAAIDAWASEALRRDGTDPAAPALIRDAVDALLGITL
jgi:L-cysteine:1D-myo-inositol 2-amino-2-deoxy-alpha-D-glucopyranoside ligase